MESMASKCKMCKFNMTCKAYPEQCELDRFDIDEFYDKCVKCVYYNKCEVLNKYSCVGPYIADGIPYNKIK